jgi:hypothetical protein
MADKINLQSALENSIWMMVWASEPHREIEVKMTYDDLVKIFETWNREDGKK